MAVTFDKRSAEKILIAYYDMPLDPLGDFELVGGAVQEMATQSGEFTFISDGRKINATFSDLVMALDVFRRMPGTDQMKTLIVGSGEMFEMAQQAAQQKQYGSRAVEVFATMEEALAFARKG